MEYLLAQRSKPSNVATRVERIKAKEARKLEQAESKASASEAPAATERPITLDDLLAEKNMINNPMDEPNGESGRPKQDEHEEVPREPEEQPKPEEQDEEPIDDYDFGYVAEMFEEDALRWMTSRLNQAQEAGVRFMRWLRLVCSD